MTETRSARRFAPLHDLFFRPQGQIPALDAMRTLAVTLVVFGHATAAYVEGGGAENLFSKLPLVRGGWIGVDLFFVLSGYFIGRQLWRELEKTGTISFRHFMIRRGLRIWPLYFSFLAFVLLVLGRGGGPSFRGWSDAVFLTNYVNQGVVMGSWSLCTEEQFYIIAPLLLIVGARSIGSVAGFRKYLVLILILLPVIRALTWWRVAGSLSYHDPLLFKKYIYTPIHTHSDGLVMGLFLANLEAADGQKFKSKKFSSGLWVGLSLLGFLVLQRLQREVLSLTGITLGFGTLIWYLLSNRPRWLGFLEWRGFYVFSRLSFGMYLNHEYMHEGLVRLGLEYLPFATRFPALHNIAIGLILFLCSATISVVTFCLIEYPFLHLRDRVLSDRRSPSPVDRESMAVASVDPAKES